MSVLPLAVFVAAFGPVLSIVQGVCQALPAVLGAAGTVYLLSVRRTAQTRFDQSVKLKIDQMVEDKKRDLDLLDQKKQQMEASQDAMLVKINARTDAYIRQLEARMEAQAEEIENLGQRVKIIELDNRNMVRENLMLAKYVNSLIDTIHKLGGELPERPQDFND